MNYVEQINKIKSLVEYYTCQFNQPISELLNNPSSEFKQSAYRLFYELIKFKNPSFCQEPHPINEVFSLIKRSISCTEHSEKSALECVERWWLEWYFTLEMDAKLASSITDIPASYVSSSTQHPMRKHELSHYARLFTVLPMPICNVCARTGDLLKVNQRFVDVFGYTLDEVPNLAAWWEKAFPDPEYRKSAKALWKNSLQFAKGNNNDIPANDYRVRCSNGSELVMEVSGIDNGDEFIAVFYDATERLKAQDILRDMAFLDSLTKIANRRRFDEQFAYEFERLKSSADKLSMIFIDVDHFKKFNDRYGHVTGDICLRDVAQKIAATVSRPEDFVARYGGEEFVVLLPQTDTQGALFIADQIQKAIEELAIPHQDSFTGVLSISMGVNTADANDDKLIFLKATDSALYYAKRQGRNCIALSSENL
ncbi:diguanylate cyclase [Pseudoalteromonas aliena]|uniref:diguanylate cyclase n=1 Tax=Pseudoalteromonas aliena TaxID=247523 RepID=A0A1Q2H172_9GAMM|nr:diguanylate cyclase [Pseudoalteromonas aliena]AQQ01114.1 diguanylate cyclase [Pseudoalteromonas aliena]